MIGSVVTPRGIMYTAGRVKADQTGHLEINQHQGHGVSLFHDI